MSAPDAPMASADSAPPAPPVPPALAQELSDEQRTACTALSYCALKLTLDAKKKLTAEQAATLTSCVDEVVKVGCTAFPLAVAVWLRNKKELGNRLISTTLLAVCAHNEALRPFVRQTASLVLKLPTDLTEFIAEFDSIAGTGGRQRPACVKKIAKDVLESLPPYQAAKYDSRTKIARTRQQLSAVKKELAETETTPNKPKGGKGNPFGKGRARSAKDEAKVKKLKARETELAEKLTKLKAGDLSSLIRYCHASEPHEMMMSILRKRYPETEEEFQEAGLPGTFDPEQVGKRLRLEVPATWDRALSEKGNVPTTWASLLKDTDAKGHYTMPYMALLRNLRNILLMGFTPGFVEKHVISRLTELRQIQGSGQTPVSLSHTWATLQKEFTDEKLKEMREQSDDGLRDIIAYKMLLKKIRGPILGTSDKQVGIIGEFLGEPVWAPCGLKRQNECFLAENRILLRGGMMLEGKRKDSKGKGKGKGAAGPKQEKWLPVACHPVSPKLLEDLKQAFDKAIQLAASCASEPICFEGDGPVVCWMDLSNPPLATASSDSTKAKAQTVAAKPAKECADSKESMASSGSDIQSDEDENHVTTSTKEDNPNIDPSVDLSLAGLQVPAGVVTTQPGQEVELDEISTHRSLCLELRYFCQTYIDYNIMAYDISGKHLWNSTYSNVEIRNEAGEKCCVHCRDISGNPSPKEPALRTLHVDVDALDQKVLALMITSQIYSGTRPQAVSIALRECHNGGCKDISGNHQPHDCKGKLLLAQDISEPLKRGGTTVYACLYRDPDDPQSFKFKNTLNLSLDSETRVANQLNEAAGSIFRQMFQETALLSTMDANQIGYVRLCQLYQAVTAAAKPKRQGGKETPVDVRIVLSGIKKRASEPEVVELKLTGEYMKDLEMVKEAKRAFSGKSVDANTALKLVLEATGCAEGSGKAPSAVLRVANNSHVPTEELAAARSRAGHVFPYGTIDARGHIFDAFRELPEMKKSVFVPGQVESCITILRNVLAQLGSGGSDADASGAELIVRYVDSFLPRDAK